MKKDKKNENMKKDKKKNKNTDLRDIQEKKQDNFEKNKNKVENAYSILNEIGVPFGPDGEPLGIWDDD